MAIELKVPTVGESITEVFIGSWLKQVGDTVRRDESVVEIETDKATLDVPAPVSGRIVSLLKKPGESAGIGEVIAVIEEGEVAAEEAAPAAAEPVVEAAPAAPAGGHIMPAAARLAAQTGVDAASVSGTGPGGRVLKEDVQAAAVAGTETAVAPEAGGRREEAVRMSPLRRTIAARLVESQQTAAILTTFNEADMSAVMALRSEYRDSFEKKHGVRLGFMSFFVKAAVDALQQIPELNAEIRGDSIIYRNYYDVGVAVSTPKGLVVPVLRNAELLSFAEVEKTVADFGRRAQANRITPDELQGGTFTISNGGVFGSLLSTPIINPPQSGVLGMHSIQERPVAVNGQVVIRPMMYLALSYDHRIVDGREAVTFLKRIKETIENPTRILLEV